MPLYTTLCRSDTMQSLCQFMQRYVVTRKQPLTLPFSFPAVTEKLPRQIAGGDSISDLFLDLNPDLYLDLFLDL